MILSITTFSVQIFDINDIEYNDTLISIKLYTQFNDTHHSGIQHNHT